MSTANIKEWFNLVNGQTEKLNSSVASHIFEVGPSEKLLVFQVRTPEDDLEGIIAGADGSNTDDIIYNVKPGIWTLSSNADDPFIMTWVSADHINYDALPSEILTSPLDLEGLEWLEVSRLDMEGSMGCVVGLETVVGFRDVPGGMDQATDWMEDVGMEMIPGGFTFGPNDYGCVFRVRTYEAKVVQIQILWE